MLTQFSQLFVEVEISHLHDRIILLREDSHLYWIVCTKWAVMYMCIAGIHFACFYHFRLDFRTVPTVWYFFYFIVLLAENISR
jgi:hypothetical protein